MHVQTFCVCPILEELGHDEVSAQYERVSGETGNRVVCDALVLAVETAGCDLVRRLRVCNLASDLVNMAEEENSDIHP